jgi:hypothetical protein
MAGASFLPIFDSEYADKLGLRGETMRQVFEILEAANKSAYTIVETGCARSVDNWRGDGQSTILFDRFVNHRDGSVLTVDINQEACGWLRGKVSSKVSVTCLDSVSFLRQLARYDQLNIDLLYLDSFDLDWQNPHPSALHHLHELCAIMPRLASGSLVVVDDSPRNVAMAQFKGKQKVVRDHGVAGKGGYVAEFFSKIGCTPVIEGYQHGWIMP